MSTVLAISRQLRFGFRFLNGRFFEIFVMRRRAEMTRSRNLALLRLLSVREIGAHSALRKYWFDPKNGSAGDLERSPGRSRASIATTAVRRPSGDEPSTWWSCAWSSSCDGRCPNASRQSSASPCGPAWLSSSQSWPCSYLSLFCPVSFLPKKRIATT